jgi:hypothetical protein
LWWGRKAAIQSASRDQVKATYNLTQQRLERLTPVLLVKRRAP